MGLYLLNHIVMADGSIEKIEHLCVPYCLHGVAITAIPRLNEPTYFIDKPIGDHGIHTVINSLYQDVSLDFKAKNQGTFWVLKPFTLMEGAEGSACLDANAQCPYDTLVVKAVHLLGIYRVERLKAVPCILEAMLADVILDVCLHAWIAFGNIVERKQQRLQV